MDQVFEEFLNANMMRAYPLADTSTGNDVTGSFNLPTSLITDIFLCVPEIAGLDMSLFYISAITIRASFIDIELSYDDPDTPEPIGSFRNIDTKAALNQTYAFSRNEVQTGSALADLYLTAGQIIIGAPEDSTKYLGKWLFSSSETSFVSSRISRGLLGVQSLTADDKVYTGNIRIREGNNVTIDVEEGVNETVLTISASLSQTASAVSLQSDADLIDALTQQFGVPITAINGVPPTGAGEFFLVGESCTTVENRQNSVVIDNPCATPCCDEDPNIAVILESIANLNLRYGQLRAFFEATSTSINNLQTKLLILGSNF